MSTGSRKVPRPDELQQPGPAGASAAHGPSNGTAPGRPWGTSPSAATRRSRRSWARRATKQTLPGPDCGRGRAPAGLGALGSDDLQEVARARHVERFDRQGRRRLAAQRVGDRLPSFLGAAGRRDQRAVGSPAAFAEQAPDPPCRLAAAVGERPVAVGERSIVPARLGVPEEKEIRHCWFAFGLGRDAGQGLEVSSALPARRREQAFRFAATVDDRRRPRVRLPCAPCRRPPAPAPAGRARARP